MAAAVHNLRPLAQHEPVGRRESQECDRVIANIILPILASLVSFLFLPFEGALLLTCAVAVLSIAIYSARQDDRAPPPAIRRQLQPPIIVVQQPQPPPPLFIPLSPYAYAQPAPVYGQSFWHSPRPQAPPHSPFGAAPRAEHEPVGRREFALPSPSPRPVQAPAPVPLRAAQPGHEPVGIRSRH